MTQPSGPQDLREALDASERRAEVLQARLDADRGVMDAISEAIYIQDAEGRFLDVNDGALRMYDRPKSFFLGQTPEVIAAPGRNDMEAVAAAFEKALRGTPQQFEYWGQSRDGRIFPKDVHLYPGTYLGQAVVVAIAQDISGRKRAEQIRDAAYRISEAALVARNLPALYEAMHGILRTLLPAENCFIALHDDVTGTISWPYWVDQVDPPPPPRPFGRGLTEYVIRTGKPQLLDENLLAELVAAGEAEFMGTESLAWMGVPLRNERRVFGALVIQSYEGGYGYLPGDLEILSFVSTQIAMAIERKAFEEQLRFASAAVESSRDSLFWIDEGARFISVNAAACTGLGYTREELLTLRVPDIDPTVTPERWTAIWEGVRNGTRTLQETTQRRKDGSFRTVELSRSMVTFEGRDLLIVSARDISGRKAMMAALQASEERFSRAFQASPDAININRLDGTYLEVNEAFTRLSGWTREETLGRSTVDLGLWADLADRDRMQQLLQAEGRFTGLESTFRMKDGSLRTGLVSGTLIQVDGETCLLSITRDITERKAAESAIRYSEDKFSRAFHASPDAINLTRLDDGTYLDVSEGFEKISGWTREEAIGKTALELDIWADPGDRAKAVELIRTQGEYTGLEIPFRRKDGRIIVGMMSGKVMDVDGVPCLLSVTRDITERKASEAALRVAEQRLRTVLAHSQAVIYQLDPEGRFLLSEGLGLANIGLSPGEAVGHSALDMFRDDRETLAQIRRALQGEASREITQAGGRLFDNFLTPVLDDQGRVESVIGIALDVTERQRVEEALRAERGLFIGGPVMVIKWRSGPDWPVEYVSPNVESILGYAAQDLCDGHVPFKSLIHPDDLARLARELAEVQGKGLSHYEQQYRLKTASGVYRWFYDFSAAAGPGPNPAYFLGYLLDITDRRQAEEALRQSQKLESLGILAGGIAHDFNNLLTVVLGNLNLAQMHLPEGHAAHAYLTNMETTVLRATELTKQMLAYSGRGHFLVRPQDLNHVVEEVTHLLEVSISKKIRLRLDLGLSLPTIHADAAQIQQVVMNLVTNASDAIGDREGAIHLTTSEAMLDEETLQNEYRGDNLAPGRYILLEVTDTGCGMPPDVLARIFDPFFTTKAAGRGLGLSAMLGILRGHGAGLSIHSTVGRGSRFRLCFPASDVASDEAGEAPIEIAPCLLQGRVLLVDDEDLILRTTGAALEALGLKVTTAQDGVEALALFREAVPRPDLVLMDLTMPRMDGREAFQAMHDLDPSVPVVLSSGFTEQDSLQTITGEGPAGFIQKPYQIAELRRVIQRVLGA